MNLSKLPTSVPASFERDPLAGVVRRRLERRLPTLGAWGPVRTAFFGTLTFGLLPLIVWTTGFRRHVEQETEALGSLAEWARARGRRPAAVGPLMASAEDLRFRPLAWLVCLLVLLFVIASFAIRFAQSSLTLAALLDCTYFSDATASPSHDLRLMWIAGLTFAYALHWVHVRAHDADLRRFIKRLNPLITAEMLPPVGVPRRTGFCLLWIVVAVMMGLYGVWWGIPMMLAGAAQRRYMRYTGPTVRRELINRMRDIADISRVPPQNFGACSNPRCFAARRANSTFCHRCGTPHPAFV